MNNFGIIFVLSLIGFINGMSLKRSVVPDDDNLDSPIEGPLKLQYDEYPLIVPKRAAMLLDRLMVALHHALEDGDAQEIKKINQLYRSGHYGGPYFHESPYKGSLDDTDIDYKNNEIGLKSNMEYDNESSNQLDNMDLQRRGHNLSGQGQSKGRVYWRCYFNAVTCF